MIAIKQTFGVSNLNLALPQPVCNVVDIVGIKIVTDTSSLYTIILYIPPSQNIETYELIFEYLSSLTYLYQSKTILLGDFNIPEYSNTMILNRKATVTNNFLEFFDWHQLNCVYNFQDRLLDLVISSNPDLCSVEKCHDSLLNEDIYHPSLLIKYKTTTCKQFHNQLKIDNIFYNFKKADL